MALLVLFACWLTILGLGEFIIVLGVVLAIAATWGAFDGVSCGVEAPSRSAREANLLQNMDERLANLETIISYEEKVAARNRRLEVAQD